MSKVVGNVIGYGMAGAILGAVAEGFDDDDDEIDKLRKWIYWSFTQGPVPSLSSATRLTRW